MESVPNVVIIYLEPSTLTAETQLTISGLKPVTVYHLYQDDYHNHRAITTDQDGRYTFIQDTTSNHTVFIQPRKSTKFINDNASGGDCQTIGIWDASSRTCTLTVDVNEAVEIDSDNLTLNGNGHVITGTNNNWSGIYLPGRKNVTITNLTLTSFSYGIVLSNARNITIQNCTITNNSNYGIQTQSGLGYTDGVLIANNTISNNGGTGIWATWAYHTVVRNNTISNNRGYGVSTSTQGTTITDNVIQDNRAGDISVRNMNCDDVIQNNIGSRGKPIKYFNTAVTLKDEELSELILCNADYSIVENVTVHGSNQFRSGGIYLYNTDRAIFTNNNSFNNWMGLFVYNSNYNIFANNNFSTNDYGVYFQGMYQGTGSSNNTMTNNMVSDNSSVGMTIIGSGNTLLNNTANNNAAGINVQVDYYLNNVYNNTVSYNTIWNNTSYGLWLWSARDSIVTHNSILQNGRYGIILALSSNNTLQDNIIQDHTEFDLHIEWQSFGPFLDDYCRQTIENNTGSGNRPIKYLSSAVNLNNGEFSELILCNADHATVSNVVVNGSDTVNNNGIVLIKTDSAQIADSTSSNNNYGVLMAYSSNNALSNLSLPANNFGFKMYASDGNTVSGINSLENSYVAFDVFQSSNNTFENNGIRNRGGVQGDMVMVRDASSGNRFRNNIFPSLRLMSSNANNNIIEGNTLSMLQIMGTGNAVTENTFDGGTISLYMADNSKVYHNNFLGTVAMLSYAYGGSNNLFNLDRPIGGNYWSNYDTPSEGCYDTDHDGFCDAPYIVKDWNNIITGADNLPWARQDGWNLPSDITSPTTTIIQSGLPGNNDWYISNVGISLTATDSDSGVKEIHYSIDGTETVVAGSSASFTISVDGEHPVGYYAVDNAGNTETAHPLSIKIDQTAPTVTALSSPAPNAAGWNNTNVTVTFTCNDATSGIESCQAPVEVASEGAGQVISGAAKDFAGLTATTSATVNIDKTVPVITASVSPSPNSAGWHNTDVTVTFACSDALSGIASCPAPITVTTEGAGQTIIGTAVDKAGNSADSTLTLNIDKTPPSIPSLSTSPGMLWPPNHKMVDVLINGSAADYGSDIASVVISVTDEYGVYNMTGLSFGGTIQLEAWREGTDGDGRQYTIIAAVTDKAGNRATATTVVLVPHDMR